jgi:hypothetical protein
MKDDVVAEKVRMKNLGNRIPAPRFVKQNSFKTPFDDNH